MDRNEIFILIGPKGTGKTFIGRILGKEFGFNFIEVERIFKALKGDRLYNDKHYIEEGFNVLTNTIKEGVKQNHIVFESTGLTDEFRVLLEELKSNHRVILIHVKTPLPLCMERIAMRDASDQIALTKSSIEEINNASIKQLFSYDFVIDNTNLDKRGLVKLLKSIVKDATA